MTAAAGTVSLAQDYLATMLADCPTWRTWVGADDRPKALGHIYIEELPPPPNRGAEYAGNQLVALRPFALISTDETDGLERARVGVNDDGGYSFDERGRLRILIEDNVAEADADDAAAADRTFKNALGQVLDELCGLAGKAGYVALTRVRLAFGPVRAAEELVAEQGDHIWAVLALEWGP
jgi:hypothetical protein